jgi:ribosome-binding ATPase YchF (GTP1/OBG family)
MLRAALIGLASSGKTTLFQLMTSARETGRATHGKGETSIGISKVPDVRLDRLTAMYNPKKRVPATVEFTDLAAPGGTGGVKALVDVAAYKNADALVHVLRAFSDPAVTHPSG